MSKQFFPYHSFDPGLYAANDSPAKLAFSGLLVSAGCSVAQSGVYDIDFSCRRPDGSILDVDVECRSTQRWRTSGAFPFPTVEIGLRRREKLANNPHLIFAIMNRDATSWIAISGATVAKHGTEIEKTVGGKPDRFLSVPVALCVQGRF